MTCRVVLCILCGIYASIANAGNPVINVNNDVGEQDILATVAPVLQEECDRNLYDLCLRYLAHEQMSHDETHAAIVQLAPVIQRRSQDLQLVLKDIVFRLVRDIVYLKHGWDTHEMYSMHALCSSIGIPAASRQYGYRAVGSSVVSGGKVIGEDGNISGANRIGARRIQNNDSGDSIVIDYLANSYNIPSSGSSDDANFSFALVNGERNEVVFSVTDSEGTSGFAPGNVKSERTIDMNGNTVTDTSSNPLTLSGNSDGVAIADLGPEDTNLLTVDSNNTIHKSSKTPSDIAAAGSGTAVRATMSSDQDGSQNPVPFDTIQVDDSGTSNTIYDTGTNQYIAPFDGIYFVTVTLGVDPDNNTVNARQVFVEKNGSVVSGLQASFAYDVNSANVGLDTLTVVIYGPVVLFANDTLEVVFDAASSNDTILSAYSNFSVYRISEQTP